MITPTWLVALSLLASLAGAGGGELETVDPRLLGVWQQVAEGEGSAEGERQTVEITADFWSVVSGERLRYRAPILGQRGEELVVSIFCNRQARRIRLDGETLTVTFTPTRHRFRPDPQETTERYLRIGERPEAFDLGLLPLGDPQKPLTAERRDAIRRELEERGRLDQQVRLKFAEARPKVTEADRERMRAVDRDNTAYLRALIREVGWVDAERFGPSAARGAWLIVQHSGDLQLMSTVLPEIERTLGDRTASRNRYALLYDRTQLWLGRKQRYGSQIFHGPEGMFVAPLEDLAGVDDRRAELGLSPLAEYMHSFLARNDGLEVPIREEF